MGLRGNLSVTCVVSNCTLGCIQFGIVWSIGEEGMELSFARHFHLVERMCQDHFIYYEYTIYVDSMRSKCDHFIEILDGLVVYQGGGL